jgi:hypothetical protein
MRELELMLGREGKRRSAEAGRADPLAAVRLGQVAPDDPADCGAPSNLVQASTGPSPTYRVPVDGAITRWSHAGDPGAAGSGRLQVWRPAGGTSYRLVGNSAVRTFAPGLNTFATSIRVRAGDLLGLRGGAEAGCMFSGEVGDLVRGDGPGAGDPAPGATRDMSIDEPELRVNVAATLEPDDRLALDVDAAARQTPEKLAVTLSCPEEACEAEISGAAVARRKSARKRAFVAFTEKAKRRVAKLGRGFPKPGRLKPVTVQHSLRELEDLQGRMIADREQFRATGPPFPGVRRQELYDLDIDVIRNAPVVILEHPTDAAASSFRARYGPEVIVEAGEPAEPHVLYPCKSRFVCYDLRSGLETTWVKSAPKGAGCTTAFTAFGSKEHNAPLGILSAAHCGGPNPKDPDSDLGVGPRFHSTERSRYGTVQKEQLLGPLDAEWHSVNYEPFKSLKPSALIYVDDTERGGKVKRVGKFDELVIGESRLCKSGITTGKGGCGRVKSLNYSPSYVPWSGQFVKADYCAQPGDSGAGVYAKIPGLKLPPGSANSYTAVGIHSGGAKDTPCRSTKFYTLFGHIEFVEKQLEVRVPLAK